MNRSIGLLIQACSDHSETPCTIAVGTLFITFSIITLSPNSNSVITYHSQSKHTMRLLFLHQRREGFLCLRGSSFLLQVTHNKFPGVHSQLLSEVTSPHLSFSLRKQHYRSDPSVAG